jgi:uncharacterized membrane protein YccC
MLYYLWNHYTKYSDLVQYRILDTVVGTVWHLQTIFLWPSWEFLNVRIHLEKAIKANQIYLQEIATFIIKGSISTSYRLARKNAFEIGNLMVAFQRMTQEPKSKQNNYHKCTNWLF